MSYRIAISFAAAAIGISCIATDASAKGGGGGGGGGGRSSGGTGKIYGPGGVSPTLGPGGGGAAGGARNYAPASYYGNATACGRYPYPPCKMNVPPGKW